MEGGKVMMLFTEGRLQAYERMMQQTYCGSRDHGDSRPTKSGGKKPAVKGGERKGCNQSQKK